MGNYNMYRMYRCDTHRYRKGAHYFIAINLFYIRPLCNFGVKHAEISPVLLISPVCKNLSGHYLDDNMNRPG